MNTNKLKELIVRFDDTSKHYFRAAKLSEKSVELEEFCYKNLYRIRYVFSKLGRLLNLHENEKINKYLIKDNNRLLKNITKVNPNFLQEMADKKLPLINMDSHKSKYAKFECFNFWKETVDKWRNDLDYANLMKKQAPEIQCRICGMDFIASQYNHHNRLCAQRLNTKEKSKKYINKFMEIYGKIANEISSITKINKANSAIIMVNKQQLPLNSPLITNKGMNNLQDISKTIMEKNKTSTPSMPSRPGPLQFGKDSQFQMNKIVRTDKKVENKQPIEKDLNNPLQIRSLDSKQKSGSTLMKPPLFKKSKEDPLQLDQKSESKINTTTETTPDTKELDSRKFTIKPILASEEDPADKQKQEQPTIKEPKDQINEVRIPEEVKEAMKNRQNVSFTPGANKRRLTRDTNKTIDSNSKPKINMQALSKISLTKPKPKAISVPGGLLIRDDPLKKFDKKEGKETNKVQDSLNFLHQFGATPDKNTSKKKGFFDFSANDIAAASMKLGKKLGTATPQRFTDKSQSGSQSLKNMPFIQEIPGFKKETSKDEDTEEEKDVVNPIDFQLKRPKAKKDSKKDTKKETKNQRKKYSQTKNKKLSVIHEENKFLADLVPAEEIPITPYFTNCVFTTFSEMLYYECKTLDSLKTTEEKLKYAKKMLKSNQALLDELLVKKHKPKTKINWSILDKKRDFFMLLSE